MINESVYSGIILLLHSKKLYSVRSTFEHAILHIKNEQSFHII